MPFDDLKTVLSYLRRDPTVTLKQALKAAARVLEYAVDFLPDAGQLPMGSGPLPDAEEVLATHMESALAVRSTSAPQPAGAFPWAVVAPILVQVLQRWLDRRR